MTQELLAKLRSSQPFRYVFIGGISYVIELSILLSLAHLLNFTPELAVACSFWTGLFVSFLLQKYIAFNSKGGDKKTLGKQSAIYGTLVAFNYLFTITFVSLTVGIIGLTLSRTAALIITTFWNYFIYRQIFKVA